MGTPASLIAASTLALSFCLSASAQEVFVLNGIVKDQDSKHLMAKTMITAKDTLEEGTSERTVHGKTDARGRYSLSLPYDGVYRVEYWAQGHVAKHVIIDLTRVKEKEREGGNTITLEITLVPSLLRVDYSAYKEAVAICRFDRRAKKFVWDAEYTAERGSLLDQVATEQRAARKIRVTGQ